MDRLARDVAHLGVIKRDLEKKGVKVIFRKLPSDASPTYNLMVNILGSFAEFERELISDRTRRGRRHKVETRRKYLGSNTAYGYRYIPMNRAAGEDGVLELNAKEAIIVRQMFEWVDQEGLSARRVLFRLNDLGIPPKGGAARWGKSSVLRILKNEMYAGVWHYNKFQGCEPRNPVAVHVYRRRKKCSVRQRPKSEWIPLTLPESLWLVPRERWQRVQEQIARNLTFSPRNEKHVYLLKGLVNCGACGSRYVGDPCHGRFYYRCHARCKRMPSISEGILDDAVKQAVRRILLNPEAIVAPLRQLEEAEARGQSSHQKANRNAEAELKRLGIEEERILEAYRTGVISPAQLSQQLEAIKARRAAITVQHSESQTEKPPPEKVRMAVSDYCAEAAKNLAGFTPERWRELLRTVIHNISFQGNQITVHGRIPVGSADPGVEFTVPPAPLSDGLRP